MLNNSKTNRRAFMTLAAAAVAGTALPAQATTSKSAEALVNALVKDVLGVINSGKSQSAMFNSFETIFARYADVPVIAQKALGPAWRSASSSQQKAYSNAFRGYMARTYGKRFNEFKGANVSITGSRSVAGGVLVNTDIKLKGQQPFKTDWHIIDARGKDKMYNLFIEGVSVLTDVRTQIGSMLDKRGGSIDKLIDHLKTAG